MEDLARGYQTGDHQILEILDRYDLANIHEPEDEYLAEAERIESLSMRSPSFLYWLRFPIRQPVRDNNHGY